MDRINILSNKLDVIKKKILDITIINNNVLDKKLNLIKYKLYDIENYIDDITLALKDNRLELSEEDLSDLNSIIKSDDILNNFLPYMLLYSMNIHK